LLAQAHAALEHSGTTACHGNAVISDQPVDCCTTDNMHAHVSNANPTGNA
jgi:hypothetical protein